MVKNGDYREALEFGEGIEDRFASDPDFLFIMGSIYYILENGDNALHYFERALAINDSDIETLALKAALHYARGEAPEARACCERALAVDPDHMASRDMLRDLDEVDEALAEKRGEGELDEARRAAVEGGMRWAGRPVAALSEAEIARELPEFKAQRETRERMANIVDRIMIAARADGDTKRADAAIDAGTGQAWAEAPSFWRGTGYGKLDELAETAKLGDMAKKGESHYPFVSISADQAEADDFSMGVVLELDADAIRSAEGTDAFRVRYMVQATVAPGRGLEEMLDTGTDTDGTLGYPAIGFAHELETRLRPGALPSSIVRRIYITVTVTHTEADLAEIYSNYAFIAPIVFVPRGYHGESYHDRHGSSVGE